MKVAIVGSGAAGLFAAGLLLEKGVDVTIFDKNTRVGRKLGITGKGRCNLTNLCSVEEFLTNVVRGQKFLKTALYAFSSQDCVDFFENLGLKTKVERGNRVFPESDKASEVVEVLQKFCRTAKFALGENVEQVFKSGEQFRVQTSKNNHTFDRVIVCTGGMSYSATGSDGAGYKFAKSFGHNVVDIRPALCPIKIKNHFIGKWQGVSLKNVQLKANIDGKKKEFFGEMLFTDEGISGPIVLTASSFINRAKEVKLTIDFKPALSEQQLEARLLREFDAAKNKDLKNVMNTLLPKTLAETFANVIGLNGGKKVNEITKQERAKIVAGLKNLSLEYGGLYDMDAAIVTSGGVELSQINPKNFESKLASGLYFLGEVLDVDALTGGFNLQIAWASAYSLAKNFE